MGKGLIMAAAVASLLVAAGGASAAGGGPYVDPHKRFVLMVPPDAQLVDAGPKIDVAIHSRKGYMISLQTRSSNADTSAREMIGKFEAANLGPGKRFTLKIGEQQLRIASLPALDVLYEGNRIRARVLVVRGGKTDFVFMFQAPPRSFDALLPVFEWVLGSFQPAPDELTAPPAAAAVAVPRPPAAAPPHGAPPSRLAQARRFADRGLGYAIDYPADWIVGKPSPLAVMFSGRQGTDAYFATVSIQNVRPAQAQDPAAAAGMVFADLKGQLASAAGGVSYQGEGRYAYAKDGLALDGHQFMVSYTEGNRRFRQLTVVLPRPRLAVAHIWSYRAPEERFDVFHAIAQDMLRSWTIQVAGN